MATGPTTDATRLRLQQAALEMFEKHGFERTTAAGIAERAGVTERTFFRYFADKRETLFGGEAVLRPALTQALAAAPAGLSPLDALFHAFDAVLPLLEGNRGFAAPRQAVIDATPALHERELAKHEALADVLAEGLRARGVADAVAMLAARAGMTAFAHATVAWLDKAEPGLPARLAEVRRDLHAMQGPATG